MIKRSFALDQIARLSGLNFFPLGKPAQNELVVALMEVAENETHATAMVTDWIRENRETPTPADFYRQKRKKRSSLGIDPHAEWYPDWKDPKGHTQ